MSTNGNLVANGAKGGTLRQNRPEVQMLVSLRKSAIDEKWATGAVLCIVKKWETMGNSVSLTSLIELLRSDCTKEGNGSCITIPKSKDGRMQVSGKKGHPHVISCRLWRWPDLKNRHDIKPFPGCKFPFSKSQENICVNPFHYQRIQLPQPLLPQNDIQNPPALNASIPDSEQKPWATILYYEERNRVGDVYKCLEKIVTVDGYTDPCLNSGRLCLGKFGNPEETSKIQQVRRLIGKGIQIWLSEDGDLYLKRLSERKVFFQSTNYNMCKKMPHYYVFEARPQEAEKVFSRKDFEEGLANCLATGFNAVYDYKKFCSVRVGFVKGWGPGYRCQDAFQTPCWMEIHIHPPLERIDKLLRGMGGPEGSITSYS